MFCPNCGADLADGAKFCPKCGTRLNEAEERQANNGPEEKPARKHTGRIIAIIAAAVVVVAAVIVIIVVAGRGNHEKIIKTCTATSDDGTVEKTTYDSDGHELTETEYDSDGNISSSSEYARDADGYILTQINYDGDRVLSSRYEYEYAFNSQGEAVSLTLNSYDSDGSLVLRAEGTDDIDNKTAIFTCYYSDGTLLYTWDFNYDNDDYIQSSTLTYYVIEATVQSEFSYDEYGNFLTEVHHFYNNEDGTETTKTTTYTYTYDEYGNILTEEKLSYDDDGTESREFTTYEYEYYD